jgi:hypothetical protein
MSVTPDMADDPYRSLAALVRKAGGYTKSTKPFAEVGQLRPERHRPLLTSKKYHHNSLCSWHVCS